MRKTKNAPMRPAKNIASAPSSMSTANHTLLANGTVGRTGGGGLPPPKPGRLAPRSGGVSSILRAVESFAIELVNDDECDHRADIEDREYGERDADASITPIDFFQLSHGRLIHAGKRSNAMTSRSIGR